MKPGRLLAVLCLGWFFLGAVGFFSDFISLVWLFSGLILLPVIAADGLALYFLADRFELKRTLPSSLAQGESVTVRLEIRREGKIFLPFKVLLWDIHPLSMECEAFDKSAFQGKAAFPAALNTVLLRGQTRGESLFFEYTLVPRERGMWFFHGAELLLSSPARLWRRKVFRPCESSGRTYPDFKKIKAQADLRLLTERAGIKNIRMRGQGLEFRSLRDYQEGDSVRAVDWRATSRKRKVIIREYQEEQDQQVLFLLDSGYRLNRQDESGRAAGGSLQFDSALEAVLLLSWVSLKHGDSVAVGSFGAGRRWIGPRKGMRSFPVLMNALYDLSCGPFPSSPFSALEDALTRLKRRTFIILVSNFREEDGESLSWILRRIQKQHLLLLVSLRERESETLASKQPEACGYAGGYADGDGFESALETAAAFSYLASRRELYRSWEHSGLLTLESAAENLSSALINRYLQVKRSGRL